MENFPILSLLTFLPIVGMIIILALPKDQGKSIKWLTLLVTGIQVVLAVVILFFYNFSLGGINDPNSFQFVENQNHSFL